MLGFKSLTDASHGDRRTPQDCAHSASFDVDNAEPVRKKFDYSFSYPWSHVSHAPPHSAAHTPTHDFYHEGFDPAAFDSHGRPVINTPTRLRGSVDPKPDEHSISAMRDIRRSVLAIPGHNLFGPTVRDIIDQYIDSDVDVIKRCVSAMGAPAADQDKVVPPDDLIALRSKLIRALRAAGTEVPDSACHPAT